MRSRRPQDNRESRSRRAARKLRALGWREMKTCSLFRCSPAFFARLHCQRDWQRLQRKLNLLHFLEVRFRMSLCQYDYLGNVLVQICLSGQFATSFLGFSPECCSATQGRVLFRRYANFSKIIRTIHTAMTSTFQFEFIASF